MKVRERERKWYAFKVFIIIINKVYLYDKQMEIKKKFKECFLLFIHLNL